MKDNIAPNLYIHVYTMLPVRHRLYILYITTMCGKYNLKKATHYYLYR